MWLSSDAVRPGLLRILPTSGDRGWGVVMGRHTRPPRRHNPRWLRRQRDQEEHDDPPLSPEDMARLLVERGLASPQILSPARRAITPKEIQR